MKNYDLTNYRSKTPTVNTIGNYLKAQGVAIGLALVRVAKLSVTDSFSNFDGTPRPANKIPEWTDPTVQLAVTFASPEGHGVHTHRFNLQGFKRWPEMTEEELKDEGYVQVGDYVCTIEDEDQLVRVIDDTRTATAVGMLDQLFSALELALGSSVHAKDGKDGKGKADPKCSLEYSISSGALLNITLRYDEEFDNWEVTSFGKVSEEIKAEKEQSFT